MKLSELQAAAVRQMVKAGETDMVVYAVIFGAANHNQDPMDYYRNLVDTRNEVRAFITLDRL